MFAGGVVELLLVLVVFLLLLFLFVCFVFGGKTPMELLGGSPEVAPPQGEFKWLGFLHSHHRHAGVPLVKGHPVQVAIHPLVAAGLRTREACTETSAS